MQRALGTRAPAAHAPRAAPPRRRGAAPVLPPCRPKHCPARRAAPAAATRAAAATAVDSAEPVLLRVVFSVRVRVGFGDVVKVVGSHDSLGAWDVARAVPMTWSEGDIWKGSALLPEHFVVRYKFIIIRSDGTLQWQPGEDSTTLASRSAALLSASMPLDVFRLNAKVPYGEEFLLVGSHASLGAWDPSRALPLRWTCTDVWQASLSLPRDEAVEYKLLRREVATGALHWVEGHNCVVPALRDTHLPPRAPDAAASPPSTPLVLPVTRHLHRQLGGWWQPWYWAPELGAADGLVYLDDPGAVPLSFEEGVTAAVDMAALLDVRDAAPNGFAGMQAAASKEGGAAGVAALRKAAAAGTAGAGASPSPPPPPPTRAGEMAASLAGAAEEWSRSNPAAAAAARSVATAGAATATAAGLVTAAGGADAAMAALAQPAAEAAALGMLVAFGARNLLFADDRKQFLAAAGSRDKLLQLIKDNMAAVGVLGDADVADAVSKSAAASGFEFDPLELLSDDAPAPPAAEASKAKEAPAPASAEAAKSRVSALLASDAAEAEQDKEAVGAESK